MEELFKLISELPASFWTVFGMLAGGYITLATTRRIKELEYKNAFFEKIIEKRMGVYDDLSDTIEAFFEGVNFRGVMVPTVLVDRQAFHDARLKIERFKHKIGWMESDTADVYQGFIEQLNSINHLWNRLGEDHNLSESDKEKELLACSEHLLAWASRLLVGCQNDIVNLYKTPKFQLIHYVPHLPKLQKANAQLWPIDKKSPPSI